MVYMQNRSTPRRLAIADRVLHTGLGKSLEPQEARIAVTTRDAVHRGIVAAGRERVVDAERRAEANDLALGQRQQRRADLRTASLDTGFRREVSHLLEGGDVLRPTVGVARVVQHV